MAKPKKFAVIDCETEAFVFGNIPSPFIWGYYDGDNYEEFTSTVALVEFISNKREIIYAHNGGKFDFHFLLDYMRAYTPVMFINGRIAKIKLGDAELRDSYLAIPVPLAAYQKDNEGYDYGIHAPELRNLPHNKKLISTYLQSDCKNLYDIMFAFREKHGNALTQAGASMKLWQKMSGKVAPQSTQKYFEDMRSYYYGGRVQCFKTGIIDKPFSVYDINSAYPAAMRHNHPFGLNAVKKHNIKADYCYDKPQAFFNITCISDGAFPYREKVGAKLLFPSDDKMRTYLITGWELKAALDNNAVKNLTVNFIYDYDELTDFREYIDTLYNERLGYKSVGDKAGDLLSKLAMNSLYGKFGSNPEHYKHAIIFDVSDIAELILGVKKANGHLLEKEIKAIFKSGGVKNKDDVKFELKGFFGELPVGERPLYDNEKVYYNVATAASITGFVRAFLFDSMCKCKDVLYCDTDSIACGDGSQLPQSKNLGDWKKEGDFYKAAIVARKLYAFLSTTNEIKDNKIASKGVHLNEDEIFRLANGETIINQFDPPNFNILRGARFVERKLQFIVDESDDI
jgi:DNA polymerase elongation subunit (family B)